MQKPVSVMWESTIACGLACKHCKASAKKTRDKDELTTQEGKDFIDQILAFGKPYPILRITGGNALMREDIFELIKYAKDNGMQVTIAPSTTPLLNRENLIKLKEAGVDVVAVSIDGHNAELHDSFRGVKGVFSWLIEATKIMREINLPFRLLTTVTKFNVRYLPEIFILSKKLGAVGWYLYMLIPTGRAREEYGLSPNELEDVFNFVYDLLQLNIMKVNAIAGSEPFRRVAVMRRLVELGELGEEVLNIGELYYYLINKTKGLLSKEDEGFLKDNTPKSLRKTRSRKKFGKGIFVAKNGDVFPSSFLPIKLGNVREESLVKIYNEAKIFKEMQNPENLKGKCKVCEFNNICRGSRSRAYAVTQDYLAEDPGCAYTPGKVGKIADFAKILEELKVTNFASPISKPIL
ncbi:MAG: radical SAM/SPASM domain-containing protein [Candidatus Hydrothermarchaeota archaeon]|nr:MAG: radical SAM/SPASM domain-containing protein [Candidatus Hydrothermarchaeota archaeon]